MEIIIPIVIFGMLFIGLPWLIFHYVTKWKQAATITTEDEKLLDELHDLARRLEDRLSTVERIVAADNPDWRALAGDPVETGSRTARERIYEPGRPPTARQEELRCPPAAPNSTSTSRTRKWLGRLRRDRRLYRHRRHRGPGRLRARSIFAGGGSMLLAYFDRRLAGAEASRASCTTATAEDAKFWQGVRANPRRSTATSARSFRDIDRRLADIETYVTSRTTAWPRDRAAALNAAKKGKRG